LFAGLRRGGQRLAGAAFGNQRAAFLAFLGFLALDDVDAHLVEHGHRVFDLLGRGLVGRKNLVQFVIGDIAAGFRLGDHLADANIRHVQQRRIRIARRLALARLLRQRLGARLERRHHRRSGGFRIGFRGLGCGFGLELFFLGLLGELRLGQRLFRLCVLGRRLGGSLRRHGLAFHRLGHGLHRLGRGLLGRHRLGSGGLGGWLLGGFCRFLGRGFGHALTYLEYFGLGYLAWDLWPSIFTGLLLRTFGAAVHDIWRAPAWGPACLRSWRTTR